MPFTATSAIGRDYLGIALKWMFLCALHIWTDHTQWGKHCSERFFGGAMTRQRMNRIRAAGCHRARINFPTDAHTFHFQMLTLTVTRDDEDCFQRGKQTTHTIAPKSNFKMHALWNWHGRVRYIVVFGCKMWCFDGRCSDSVVRFVVQGCYIVSDMSEKLYKNGM